MRLFGGVDDEPNPTGSNILNITAPSDTIHVRSWDELDNLTADALLGQASGMKLKTYSYECVDTINYSTLIFNIDAVVANADGRESHISKTAEWSVELVSVEYYPYIEVWAPHDNMILCYYGKLDRYRNYSDGSRIGPDHFENYGHFIESDIYAVCSACVSDFFEGKCESIFPDDLEGTIITDRKWTYFDLKDPMVVGHDYMDKSGLHSVRGYRLMVNRNAYTKYAEGIIPIESEVSVDFTKDLYSRYENPLEDVFDFETYIPTMAYMEATDEMTVFNMCKDVPIINRPDTVREVHTIETGFGLGFEVPVTVTEKNVTKSGSQPYWGWYYERFYSGSSETYLSSNNLHYYNTNFCIYDGTRFYCSYINIDGRVIDFVDLCNVHNEPIIKTCTRTAEGYHYHLEENTTQYGLPLQRNFDLYIDFYDGPFEVIYEHDYRVEPDYIEKRDKEKEEELRKQHDAERTRSIESRGMLEGKPTVHIDTRLPVSFNRK